MSRFVRRAFLWVVVALLVPTHMAASQEADDDRHKFDPSGYLGEKAWDSPKTSKESGQTEVLGAQVKFDYIFRNGTRYLRLKSENGALLLPDLDHFTASDLEKAECVDAPEQSSQMESETTAVQGEVKLKPQLRLYSAFIVKAVRKKCFGKSPTPPRVPPPALETGVSIEERGRRPKRYRIFNRNLGPNLGVGVDF